jgi:hypothetical protein
MAGDATRLAACRPNKAGGEPAQQEWWRTGPTRLAARQDWRRAGPARPATRQGWRHAISARLAASQPGKSDGAPARQGWRPGKTGGERARQGWWRDKFIAALRDECWADYSAVTTWSPPPDSLRATCRTNEQSRDFGSRAARWRGPAQLQPSRACWVADRGYDSVATLDGEG